MSEMQTETVAPAAKAPRAKPKKKAKKPARALVVHKPAPPAAPRNFLQIIAEATLNPACDVGKMQALLDMQRQIEERDARKAFDHHFLALQHDLPAIRQDGKIVIPAKEGRAGQSTPYATFNNIMKTISPLLFKHGFTLSFATEPAGERLLVTGTLAGHGHSRTTAFPLPAETSGSKNNVQGWGSSMSYGKRYCTIALLNIISEAREDADTNGVTQHPAISAAQLKQLQKLAGEVGADIPKFCGVLKVETLADLPAARFDEAVGQLERKRKAAEQRKATQNDGPSL